MIFQAFQKIARYILLFLLYQAQDHPMVFPGLKNPPLIFQVFQKQWEPDRFEINWPCSVYLINQYN